MLKRYEVIIEAILMSIDNIDDGNDVVIQVIDLDLVANIVDDIDFYGLVTTDFPSVLRD